MATTYTVQKGDTLNAISAKYGFKNYKEAGITGYKSGNPDLIYAGEVLTIGGKAPASTVKPPATTADVTSTINANQDADIAGNQDEPPSRDGTTTTGTGSRYSAAFSDMQELLGLDGKEKPDSPSFEKMYKNLRGDYNVDDLETFVSDLQAEEEEIFATLRERRTAERGKPVAMNVIEGRISETERQEAERIDYIRRQKQTAVNQLQAANAAIENLINFRKLDYDTARNEYNDQFSQQLQLFNTVKGVVDTENAENERNADNARANLNIIYGTLKDGGLDAKTLSPDMQYTINKLELGAGLPTGFYQNIASQNPEGKILSTTTRTTGGGKYADVLYQNKDGSLTAKSVYLGGDTSGSGGSDSKLTDAELLRASRSEMSTLLSQKVGEDGKVAPTDWKKARTAWVTSGLLADDFDKAFAQQYAVGAQSGLEEYGFSRQFIIDNL